MSFLLLRPSRTVSVGESSDNCGAAAPVSTIKRAAHANAHIPFAAAIIYVSGCRTVSLGIFWNQRWRNPICYS